jgi:cardiolipin synthase A/B
MTVLLLILLALPILALAVVGARHLLRGTPVRWIRPGAHGDDLPAIADGVFVDKMELLTGVKFMSGNEIHVLNCGDETYPALWDALSEARTSITMQMYYARPGRVADRLLEILTDRARNGVKVLFLRDAFGAKDLKDEYVAALRDAGVEVASFRPVNWLALDKAYARSHIRVVVIDGKVGFTGGFGIDDKWLGGGRRHGEWRETNARFTGPAVAQLQAAFAVGWAEATGSLLAGENFYDLRAISEERSNVNRGEAVAGVLHTAPTIGSTAAERLLALTITGARERLWITNAYFVPDDDFVRLLIESARRGVDVRILTASDESDVKTTLYAGRGSYETLLEGGVRVFEYQPSMHHAKTFVADGRWCCVGTMNFDNRSMAFNDESMLLAYDESLARELEQSYESDLAHSEEIELETFRKRPWHRKAMERAARLGRRIL